MVPYTVPCVRVCCSNSLCIREYVRYGRFGESREQRYESRGRGEREFRCAIARSEFGERTEVLGSHLNRGAPSIGTTDKDGRRNK